MWDILGAAIQGLVIVVLLAPVYCWISIRRKRRHSTKIKESYDEMRSK